MGSQAPLPAQKPLYGWTLRVASWVLRTVGVMATLAGFAAWQVPGWTWKGILIGTSIVGVVFTVTGLELSKYARRHLVPTAESPDSLAPGAYVLYLRPFSLDASMDQLDSVFDNTLLSAFQSGRTREERLARMFRRFGRLVTVGRPGEPIPRGSGARRVYIPRSGWQPIVADLISNARVVILGAGPGTGTVWEYVQVLRGGDPSRFIVLVTDRPGYQHFRKLATAAANEALAELQARHGSSFQVPDLPGPPPRGQVPVGGAHLLLRSHGVLRRRLGERSGVFHDDSRQRCPGACLGPRPRWGPGQRAMARQDLTSVTMTSFAGTARAGGVVSSASLALKAGATRRY